MKYPSDTGLATSFHFIMTLHLYSVIYICNIVHFLFGFLSYWSTIEIKEPVNRSSLYYYDNLSIVWHTTVET